MDDSFGFISPADFFAYLRGDKMLVGSKLLLTFDDGFKSDRIVADQILKELGINAVFFVCPKIVEAADKVSPEFKRIVQNNVFNGIEPSLLTTKDYDFMNWEDLKALANDGHTIGSHTWTHQRLSSIKDVNELRAEVAASRIDLETKLNIKVNCFSYPFGNNQSINALAYEIMVKHYDYCFTGLRGVNTVSVRPHHLFRDKIEIEAGDEFNLNILEGMMDWYYWLKKRELNKISGDELSAGRNQG
ncbi:MAG: polysaccharide deacetylase family protein [Candidatus Vogelbacteria bacterium]|nr:polysaccharide deacetylase family protein [Candidatus Vogelbacteria bacterium]